MFLNLQQRKHIFFRFTENSRATMFLFVSFGMAVMKNGHILCEFRAFAYLKSQFAVAVLCAYDDCLYALFPRFNSLSKLEFHSECACFQFNYHFIVRMKLLDLCIFIFTRNGHHSVLNLNRHKIFQPLTIKSAQVLCDVREPMLMTLCYPIKISYGIPFCKFLDETKKRISCFLFLNLNNGSVKYLK